MAGMRLGLGLGLGLGRGGGSSAPANPLCDAIKRKVCVSAKEKAHSYLIAPHIVYRGKDDAHFLDGIVLEKDGKEPNRQKLETFPLANLTDVTATSGGFTPEAGFDAGSAKYGGKTICVVEIV